MCGIAGYIGTREIGPAAVETCLDAMRRRGPDQRAARHWVNAAGRHVHLLFTRLSIIDLDARSSQPLQVDDDWIVFNGELYNYVEQRDALAAAGRGFRTRSDTEVMLAGLRDRGWEALDDCEGMWAFGVYSQGDGSLTLCRDRFGEKPLYIYRDSSGLYFGSEIKFIFALLGHRLPVNGNHLRRYLVNGYKALYKGTETFFEGISEVRAGHFLRIAASGRESLHRYWQPRLAIDDDMSYANAVAGARERLINSVGLRLRADVPLAFCMSGGVDSNALISIAKRVFGYDVHGFTIVNDDARYEEQDMVDCAVRELGVRNTPIPVTTDRFLERLRELVRYHDAPVYTITYYAQWMLQEAIAAAGYRISVSGTAADEIFSGYYDHHLAYLQEVKNDTLQYTAARAAWMEYIRPIVRNPQRHWQVKEPMAITMIDPRNVAETPFDHSHLLDKLRALLVCAREWKSNQDEESRLIKLGTFDLADGEIFRQVQADYELVQKTIRNEGAKALTGWMGNLVQPRSKGPGHGVVSHAFYARTTFVARMLKLSDAD